MTHPTHRNMYPADDALPVEIADFFFMSHFRSWGVRMALQSSERDEAPSARLSKTKPVWDEYAHVVQDTTCDHICELVYTAQGTFGWRTWVWPRSSRVRWTEQTGGSFAPFDDNRQRKCMCSGFKPGRDLRDLNLISFYSSTLAGCHPS